MKASFEFDLPEEAEAFSIHSKAVSIHCDILELDQHLRSLSKYENKETVNIVKLREILNSILNQEGSLGFSGL